MEWVETTGRTLEEAKERALDQLGVHEEDAEFDVVEEPRPGLFGRIRGEARVRARVRPTQPRPKAERRDRKRKPQGEGASATPGEQGDPVPVGAAVGAGKNAADEPAAGGPTERGPTERASAEPGPGEGGPAEPASAQRAATAPSAPRTSSDRASSDRPSKSSASPPPASSAPPADNGAAQEAERETAAAFLQGLAEALGEPARAEIVVLGDDEAEVRLEGGDLGVLIGPRGQTLLAVQDLTRLAAQRRGSDRQGRLRVDIAGYRERRKEALTRFSRQVAAEVLASGSARALEPMSSMDRKVVHDTVNDIDGVETVSEGEDPQRRVVIRPAGA